METTYLYRAFDGDGALLYVGITNNMARRADEHWKSSGWWVLALDFFVETFQSRDEAEIAEKLAIQEERPMYNVTHVVRDRPAFNRENREKAVAEMVAEEMFEARARKRIENLEAQGLSPRDVRSSLSPRMREFYSIVRTK